MLSLKEMRALVKEDGVYLMQADQCMYGLKTPAGKGWLAAKKPSKFPTTHGQWRGS